MALSKKRKAFVIEYVKDFNCTQAAIRAGYSEKTAYSIGNEVLKIPEVEAEIKRLIDEKCMGADEALLRLAEQARAEYAAYFKPNGMIDLEKLLADGKGHLIKKIKPTAYGNEIEFYDSQAALLNIGRHHKLFVDRMDVSGGLEFTESESAAERIASRLDSIVTRIRAQGNSGGTSANAEGSGGT